MTRPLTALAAAALLGAFLLCDMPALRASAPFARPPAPATDDGPPPPAAPAAPARELVRGVRPEPAPADIRPDPREPATRAEWGALFDRLPTDEWGGGDVSVSVRLASGRRLWMYGDTLSSRNVFVHSSAIVTHGRTIRVANGGRQILPVEPAHDGRRTVYWTETLSPLEGERVLVTTTPVSVSLRSLNAWDLRRVGERSRQGVLHVDADGDVEFLGWAGWVPRPDIGMDSEDFASPRPGHFTYGAFVHPIRLRNGTFLRTRNRNYSGVEHRNLDGSTRFEMWRPTFETSPTRLDPYWGR